MPLTDLAYVLAAVSLVGIAALILHPRHRVRVRPGQFRALVAGGTYPVAPAGPTSLSTIPELELKGVHGSASGNSERSTPSVLAESTATALLGATLMGAEWHSLDGHIFDAFAQLTGEQVHGFWDLTQVVNAHGYQLTNENFASMLAGHVAEFHVQDHLVSAGAQVVMPHASNFAGLDLFANGSPFNVKDYADASGVVSDHLASHPNIGVVLNGDAAHIPADALHFDAASHLTAHALDGHSVLVDDSLSHAAIQAHNEHAMNLLAEHGGGAAHAFPIASFIVSGIREGRLVAKGHTDVVRAAKNVATDGAIRGGSIFLGAKAGALVGLAAGPHGAIIGGILGAIGASFAGGAVAKSVREKPLSEVRQAYDAQAHEVAVLSMSVERDTAKKWKGYQDAAQSTVQTKLTQIEADSARQRDKAAKTLALAHQLSPEDANRVIAASQKEFDTLLAERRARLPRSRVGMGILRPRALVDYLVTRHDHQVWSSQAAELVVDWQAASDPAPIFDQALALPAGHQLVTSYVHHVDQARADAVRVLGAITQRCVIAAAKSRAAVVARLKQQLDKLVIVARKKLEPASDLLVERGEALKDELRKAGKATA